MTPTSLLAVLLLVASACAADVQIEGNAHPSGAVLLIVDGLGSSYVYPEDFAYALDGSPLGRATLYNLTGDGARVLDMYVPVPSTGKSHSILVTGAPKPDESLKSPTIFDCARDAGYLAVAILERGDTIRMLQETDAFISLDGNSIKNPKEPLIGWRPGGPASPDLLKRLEGWRDVFDEYTAGEGVDVYVGYNAWALDAASDLVDRMDGPFIIVVNVGAVDSAGQYLGVEGYLDVVQGLDIPLGNLTRACERNGALLIITADHGMAFPSATGKGGHEDKKYSSMIESHKTPFVAIGPGVDEVHLAGDYGEDSIAPTLLRLMGISGLSHNKEPMPLSARHDLQVICSGDALVYRDGKLIAKDNDSAHIFRGLDRGLYTVKAGGVSREICLMEDTSLDLRGARGPIGVPRWIVGLALILLINVAGIIIILRIWKDEGAGPSEPVGEGDEPEEREEWE